MWTRKSKENLTQPQIATEKLLGQFIFRVFDFPYVTTLHA